MNSSPKRRSKLTPFHDSCNHDTENENMVLLLVSVDEVQKLLARLVSRSHAAEHAACSGGSASLLNAAHDHAKMARFDDDGDALWLEHL